MKQSGKALVGACGGYCGGCSDYLAYISNDEKLKRKLAEGFSKQFDRDIKPEGRWMFGLSRFDTQTLVCKLFYPRMH